MKIKIKKIMEFIEYLDKTEVEIIKMVEKAGYKTSENKKLCLISENYVGFFNRVEKEIIICTSNAKKREGYNLKRKKNKDIFYRTALHIKKALRHEAVHVAQECNDGNLLKIDRRFLMNPSKINALNGSISISGEEEKERQAYILEDKPRLIKKGLRKYCL
ncbi:serine hydroxymethyltransferase [Prochlorococcus marinus]|uniref:serine hydroxymethyltransferase n=1 Tax=Prochlorococcus marinus TaxID=1219 RepID=UPI0022B2B67E|nr:serine hydroxymethyltransferase [Prochlorococcus marinus]